MVIAAKKTPDGASTEVPSKATRRRFTAKYKPRILRDAEACNQPGQISALLRREGLYSSHLTTWRKARERGELAALAPKKRGRKAKRRDARDAQIAELERDNTKLRARLERAEVLLDLQKNGRRGPPLLDQKLRAAILDRSRGEAVNFLERLSPQKNMVQGCLRACKWRRFGGPV